MNKWLHLRLSGLKKLSYARLLNASKSYFSFYISRLTGNAIHPGLPVHLSIEPTTACNLRCPECPSGLRSFTRKTGNLSVDTLENLLVQVGSALSSMTFYFQGEPFIHPLLPDMIRTAHRKGIYTITSTNGHFFNDAQARATIESGLDKLIVSVDGTSQDVYAAYRKEGDLAKVLAGIENIVAWKKKLASHSPFIELQFVVFSSNEHQIREVKALGKTLGVDRVALKSAQLNDFVNGNPLMPAEGKYSRYKKNKDGTYRIKNRLDNHCWKMWHSAVITWDGNMVPCCFDKDASHQMGNILHAPLANIWNNDAYLQFRKQLFRSRKDIDICNNCSSGTRVWLE